MVSFTALRVKIRQPVYFCQTNALQGRIIWYDAPRFPRRKQASTKHYPVVGFPSGQREQTVNLPSSTSKVRILPPPPSLHVLPSLFHLRYAIFCPTGKDEKLRLRFDSSEARERCRRQRPEGRGALAPSNPSPTTIFLKNTSIQLLYDILYSAPRGRMRSFDQGSTRAKRENVAAGNGPKARRFSAE